MAKDMTTIDGLIAAEEKKLASYEEKRAVLDGKIKACRAAIDKYTMMKNHQQFNAISNALDGKGISFEDVLAALKAGDLLSLQEKMESSAEEEVPVEEVDGEDDTESV